MANKDLQSIRFPGLADRYVIPDGLSDEAKEALLTCFEHVAWTDENGQEYVDALENALYEVELTGITAVFSQGSAVIYDTDTLDDLKQYLTVTATYSDSTTATITAYTLSGTLTAGTSTITASYGGKTDTFNVEVTSENIFNPATSPDVNLFTKTSDNSISSPHSSDTTVYHSTYVPISPNHRYKITKSAGTQFRIALTAQEPANGVSILYTEANHSGTEITVDVSQPNAAYLFVTYATNVTAEVNEQLRQSLVIEEIESPLWLFTDGYMAVVGSGNFAGLTYRLGVTARACGPVPVANNGYTFTVTDSTKYNVAAAGITSLEKIANSGSEVIDGYGYASSNDPFAWGASASVTAPFVWLSLKKMDGTAFTSEELADGAAAVFTYTTS